MPNLRGWPDERPFDPAAARQHAAEVKEFGDALAGAEVVFAACTYRDLLGAMQASQVEDVQRHTGLLEFVYRV
jgi:hypothetical protein